MGRESNIQWCDSTVNPTSGCDGCELWVPGKGGPCYAGALHEGRLAQAHPQLYAADFTQVRTIQGRMEPAAGWSDLTGTARPLKPWLDGMPRMIFVGDMGDIFSGAVEFPWLWDNVFSVMASKRGARHVWLVLTKRPSRAAQFGRWLRQHGHSWPANCWCGTSITGRASLSRVGQLLAVPAPKRFLSVEPMVEWVDLSRVDTDRDVYADPLRGIYTQWCEQGVDHPAAEQQFDGGPKVDWLILGGESDQGRHKARPFDLQWAYQLRDLCAAADVPFFLKQLGSRVRAGWSEPEELGWRSVGARPGGGWAEWRLRDSHGGDWSEWPRDLHVRQVPQL